MCGAVPAATSKAIAGGTRKVPLKVTRAYYVIATSRPADAFYIAIRFAVPGGDVHEGVWAIVGTNRPDTQGMIIANDPVAHRFTVWPRADLADTGLDPNDVARGYAVLCLQLNP